MTDRLESTPTGDRAAQPPALRASVSSLSRRRFMCWAGLGGSAALYAALPGPVRAAAGRASALAAADTITPHRRRTLRSLWDAVVPGTWEGVVEDILEDGTPAPGATDARVQEWLELVANSLPDFLEWLTEAFLAFWAEDIDLWADFTEWPWLDDEPDFADLPLAPCKDDAKQVGRQSKIILMQSLFHTLIDVQYQAAIIIARVAFFCDFWYEARGSRRRVGRQYIGFPLPPGTRPYRDFTYDRALGESDADLIIVNPARHLVALP